MKKKSPSKPAGTASAPKRIASKSHGPRPPRVRDLPVYRADDLPELLTVKEAQTILRVSRPVMYALLDRQEIPGAARFGHTWRIPKAALLRLPTE